MTSERAPPVPLTDSQVDIVPVVELRAAYRALRDFHAEALERRSNASRAAIAEHRAQGRKLGRDVAYGFRLARDGSTLLRHEGEQDIISVVCILRQQSNMSLRDIARELTTRGNRARNGRPFDPKQISRMLASRAPEPE